MTLPSYDALTRARAIVAEIETKRVTLANEHAAATTDLADADAALTHELAAARLGESSADELVAATRRQESASRSLRSIGAALAVLAERLAPAQQAVIDAETAFRAEAGELLRPAYERQCEILRTQAEALAQAYTELAQYATVVGRCARGSITGAALLRGAGDPLEVIRREMHVSIDLGFTREPRRMTEAEILERITLALPEAAE